MALTRDIDAGVVGEELWRQLTQPPLRQRLAKGRRTALAERLGRLPSG